MENAQRKAKDMASTEPVRRVENATPKDNNNGAASKAKKCVKCTYVHRRTQTTCPADGKPCNACKKPGHFKMSTLCQGQPTQPVRYLSSEEDEPAHPARSHKVRCVTGQPKPLVANRAISTLPAASDLPPGSTESDDSGREQSCVTPHTHTIRTLTTHPHQHTTGHCQVHINGVKLTLFADTGVKKTLLNRRHWECIQHTATMQRTTKTFSAYGAPQAHHLPVAARAKVTIQAEKEATTETYVYIVDDQSVESLLGRQDGIALGILSITPAGAPHADTTTVHRLLLTPKTPHADNYSDTRQPSALQNDIQKIVGQHQHMFQGVGKAKNQVVDIPLKADARPYIQPPRPIPFHFHPQLQKYLKELSDNDIIEGPLQGPLEAGTYVSNIVITAKRWSTEEIRVNLDLRQINKDIVMSHHPIPTPEDLRHEFRHSDTFSSLDANHMFFQWEVKEDKRKIFTFRTPWGLYRFKRLASGVNIASAECNNNLRALLTGLEGIVQIQDDIVVHGKGRQHDERLASVLNRLDQEGFTLRRDKCVFGQPEIAWFGKVYSKTGVSIDPNKTRTIQTMPVPTTKEETVSFLQMAQFNLEFLHPNQLQGTPDKNYAQLTAPLRAVKQQARFTWTQPCQTAFDTIKKLMASDKVLVHYDPHKPTRVYVDFSPHGVSATLAKRHDNWRPVTHVSEPSPQRSATTRKLRVKALPSSTVSPASAVTS